MPAFAGACIASPLKVKKHLISGSVGFSLAIDRILRSRLGLGELRRRRLRERADIRKVAAIPDAVQ